MKTITMRIDDDVYKSIKLAAEGQKRNIANFIEFATMQYLHSSAYVDDIEMENILKDEELVANLRKGLQDAEKGDWKLV